MTNVRRQRIVGVVAVVAALVLAAAGCSSSKSDGDSGSGSSGATTPPPSAALKGTPIVIGSVGQYSGFASATSKATADAVSAWAQWKNAHGGISGHPVTVIVKDDQADPAKSLSAVKTLVEKNKVIALVGIHESGLESAWRNYIDSRHVPVVGGASISPSFETDPLFFPTGQTSQNYTAVQVNTAKLAGKKKVGAIVCAELPACQSAFQGLKGAANKLGLQFAAGLAVSGSAPNYTSQCLSLRSSGVEAVITDTAQEVTTRFISDCARQNYKPAFITSGESYSDELVKNPAYEGAYVANDAFNWFSDDPALKNFQQAMKTYEPKTPLNSSASVGWSAAVLFGSLLSKATAAAPTSADLLAALQAQPPNNTLGGLIPPTTYTKDKPATVAPCGWYAQVKGGKLTAPFGNAAVCLK